MLSQTRVHRLPVLTHAALDLAAPQESAVATLGHQGLVVLESASAAHQITAVNADGRLIAHAAVCAQYAQAGVCIAESGRWFQIHQILGSGVLELGIVRL